jgi:amino acid adenylation domain-containing protein
MTDANEPCTYRNGRYALECDQLPARTGTAVDTRLSTPSLIPSDSDVTTPRMLSLPELDPCHTDVIVRTVPGGARNVQDIYPLCPAQEGVLFHHLLNRQGDSYVLSTLFELQSRFQVESLVSAIQCVIDRHDVLRSAVLWEELPRAVQVVYRHAALPVEETNASGGDDPIEQLKARMRSDCRAMDVRRAPLARLQIVTDTRGQSYALFQLHHLACDDLSWRAVLSEIAMCLEGRKSELPVPVPFRDYVAEALARAHTQDVETFFRSKLADVDDSSAPFGLRDIRADGRNSKEAGRTIDMELAGRIRAQAMRLGASPARLFHAAWALVVAKTSGRDDIVFGTVLLGARQRSTRALRMLGPSINTLPLRLRLNDVTAEELVRRTHRELVELLQYRDASLSLVQQCSSVARGESLFTALLNYRHRERDQQTTPATPPGLRTLAQRGARTNYPITVAVDDLGEGFDLVAQTDPRIDPNRVARYLETAVESLVTALEQAPERAALSLSILPADERQQLLEVFNATAVVYPRHKLIHELFEEQAQRSPAEVAIVHESGSLTYAALNAKANKLARLLIHKGVAPDQPVAICLERSVDLIVGVLAILKAGGAYMPLDPMYPTARLEHMLCDAAPSILLTQTHLRNRFHKQQLEMIAIDEDRQEICTRSEDNISSASLGLRSDHLAYVIYTSGSTGQPKGSMITHGNVLNLWQGLKRLYRESPAAKRIALNASFNFDASVQQLVQLLSGSTLVLVPERIRSDAALMLNFIRDEHINAIDCTPSQMKSWVAAGLLDLRADYPLHTVLVGGEAIDASLWNKLSQSPFIQFFNVYGPTECTVDTTAAAINADCTAPHIGRPMINSRVYILDRCAALVPIGVPGEIFIGGAGTGRGYINRADMTAQRFVVDPFDAAGQALMYRTGDVGKWRDDGTIEYLGRNDQQVKIRGYRIEVGEIEAHLTSCVNVKDAAVVAGESGQQLVAYIVPREAADGGAATNPNELRAHLRTVLPEYMVPSAFVTIAQLPLTTSGKLDRRALPTPDLSAYATAEYEAPQGETEELMAGIWQSLLHVERVGRQDSFFELGGHSLLAMQMATRIHQAIAIEVPIGMIFECATLQVLSTQVDALRRNHLIDRVSDDESDMKELIDNVASMPDHDVQALIRTLTTEARL